LYRKGKLRAFKFFNFEKLITPLISLAKDASVPVTVNLDWKKNIWITREVTKIAHAKGVSVEGEVGVVDGLESFFCERRSCETETLF